ncbi:MAG: HEAT repeat domain-containing protein [Candidatus Helarchaeota archaeon]|nr:HEAT repeat domain-containing protein [Candidatus Helarchaeota archaeon]
MEIITQKPVYDKLDLRHIINLFGNDDYYLKRDILKNITAEENQKIVIPYLIDALKHPNHKIRFWAIIALGVIKDPLTLDILISAYRDKNPKVRRILIETLLLFEDPKIIPILIRALNDDDIGVKRYAAEGLGEFHIVEAVLPLFKHLFDLDTRVRCEVVNSLKKIDEIFAIIITPNLVSELFFMRNLFRCRTIIYKKISEYFSKLEQYPEIISMTKRYLEEFLPIYNEIHKPKPIKLYNFKLGKFRNRARYTSKNWSIRLLEEEEKLEKLLAFHDHIKTNFSLVRAEFDNSNSRKVYCTVRFFPPNARSPELINFQIRMPLKYPKSPPKACSFSLYKFIEHHHDVRRWDDEDPDFKGFRFACFGKLESRWQSDGSMGIAHYIQLLCYYAAFDHFSFKL